MGAQTQTARNDQGVLVTSVTNVEQVDGNPTTTTETGDIATATLSETSVEEGDLVTSTTTSSAPVDDGTKMLAKLGQALIPEDAATVLLQKEGERKESANQGQKKPEESKAEEQKKPQEPKAKVQNK